MTIDPESAVQERYSAAAKRQADALCCPVSYDARLLEAIPAEVRERDYGCGDPSAHLRSGETVLDLGSGGGKICFIAAQVVGPAGRVIGIDVNEEMLALARSAAPEVAARIGYANVEFRTGRIQDLTFDPVAAAGYLASHPMKTPRDALAYQDFFRRHPLVAAESVDVVVSNCVLNLVRGEEKAQLFREIFRVLKVGGRAVISDIACDEDVPEHLEADPELWSGCVGGALREDRFLQAFLDAGFYGVRILARDEAPWRSVEGLEFRSVTVEAFKGMEGPCHEGLQTVIYRGPFAEVRDDDGHRIPRGVRYAVCEKTFALFACEPYRDHFEFVEPRVPVAERKPYDCARDALRHPRETKGLDFGATTDAATCCGPEGC
ncbi:MAG: methyltransferase domain-containing protein [Planctomycetota bacterium]|jgi:SAM-dependent methyltransferase